MGKTAQWRNCDSLWNILSEKDCFVLDVSIVCDRNKIKLDGVHGAPDLVDGVLTLNKVYAIYPDYTLEQMTPEEKADALAPMKCSLYDDLEIDFEDIFNGLLPIV